MPQEFPTLQALADRINFMVQHKYETEQALRAQQFQMTRMREQEDLLLKRQKELERYRAELEPEKEPKPLTPAQLILQDIYGRWQKGEDIPAELWRMKEGRPPLGRGGADVSKMTPNQIFSQMQDISNELLRAYQTGALTEKPVDTSLSEANFQLYLAALRHYHPKDYQELLPEIDRMKNVLSGIKSNKQRPRTWTPDWMLGLDRQNQTETIETLEDLRKREGL